jgi:dCTP deaminase
VPKPNCLRRPVGKWGDPVDNERATDSRHPIEYETTVSDSFWIPAHGFVLVRTREVIGISDRLTAFVEGRSSVGRLGLFTENAGWVDPGFVGSVTLELFNALPHPLLVHAGTRVCQLVFARVDGSTEGGYHAGKYQQQVQTTGSLLHKDFAA